MTRRIPFAPTLVLAAAVVDRRRAAAARLPRPLDRPTEIVTAALTSTGQPQEHVHARRRARRHDDASRCPAPAARPTDQARRHDRRGRDLDIAGQCGQDRLPAAASSAITGELIVVDGKAYLKTSLQGPQYEVLDLGGQSLPVDPSNTGAIVDALRRLPPQPGVDPVKGDDVACGSTPVLHGHGGPHGRTELAALGLGAVPGLPVDVTGASLAVTVRVEKDLPHHLAGLTFVVTTGDASAAHASTRSCQR